MAQSSTISGEQLRARIKRLGLTYVEAAPRFGLTLDGLHKQMNGLRPVSRQTEIILELRELLQKAAEAELPGRRRRQRRNP